MSILTQNPPNQNFLQSTKFQVIFPRISEMTYFCQDISIPGIQVTSAKRSSPFVDLYVPGDKADYDIFSMTFLLDEDLWGWEIIHDWIRGYSFPSDFEEYSNLKYLSNNNMIPGQPQYSEGKLIILSALNNPRFEVRFYELFPISISGVDFSSKESADKVMTATAQFRYQYYDVKRV